MDLICITDAVKTFGISSKTLRYYENVGILKSIRMDLETLLDTEKRTKIAAKIREAGDCLDEVVGILHQFHFSTPFTSR